MYFSIRLKILSGFFVILLMLFASGAISNLALNLIQDKMRENMNYGVGILIHVDQVDHFFQQARLQEEYFYLHHEEKYSALFQEYMIECHNEISLILQLYKEQGLDFQDVEELTHKMQEYQRQFLAIVDLDKIAGNSYQTVLQGKFALQMVALRQHTLTHEWLPWVRQFLEIKDQEEKYLLTLQDPSWPNRWADLFQQSKSLLESSEAQEWDGATQALKLLNEFAALVTAMNLNQSKFGQELRRLEIIVAEIPRVQRAIQSDAFDNMEQRMQTSKSYEDGVAKLLALMMGLATLFGIVTGWYVASLIVTPVKAVIKIARNIAKGELTQDEIITQSNDETRDLTESLNGMQKSLQNIIVRIRSASNRIMSFSTQVNTAAKNVADTALRLDQEVTQQRKSLDECNIIIHRMDKSIKEVAINAEAGAKASQEAQAETNTGNELIQRMQHEMGEIANNTREVRKITQLINEIASRTEILALNAAVEAVKAGEYGQGFTVVALEVRRLAEITADSAKQIEESLTKSNRTVEAGVEITNNVNVAFQKIRRQVELFAEQSAHIYGATQEQRENSHSVVQTLHEVVLGMESSNREAKGLNESAFEQSKNLNDLSKMALETLNMMKIFKIKGSIITLQE